MLWRLSELRVMKQFLEYPWVKPATPSHPPHPGVAAKLAGNAIWHVSNQDLYFLEELRDRCLINAGRRLGRLLLAVLEQRSHSLAECLNLAPNSLLSWSCLWMAADELKDEPCDCFFFIGRVLELGERPGCGLI